MVKELNSADVNTESEESYKLYDTSQTKVDIISSLCVGFSRIQMEMERFDMNAHYWTTADLLQSITNFFFFPSAAVTLRQRAIQM